MGEVLLLLIAVTFILMSGVIAYLSGYYSEMRRRQRE